jgi:hypothetical protein
MGNSKSILGESFIQDAPHITTSNETMICRNLRHSSVVCYFLNLELYDYQVLSFDRIVDAVGGFQCLTSGATIDIFINDEIHYKNVEDFTLFLVAMRSNTIRVRTYQDGPIVVTCIGYSFNHSKILELTTKKIKTSTTKYKNGKAFKLSHQ